jgi:predicted dithiol-disulfide oxidoreductase (DUF899 family)
MNSEVKRNQPDAAPPVVGRAEFEVAWKAQVELEKEVTRLNDRVSAARRRLPMTEVEDYVFTGPEGPVKLTELFGDHYLLLVQNFMFDPSWDVGCSSCSWGTDNLPADMSRMTDAGIAFAMVSQAPIEKLEKWRVERGWDHRWVSSFDTSYHHDWGWTREDDDGQEYQMPGYSYYLLKEGRPYLTYMTTRRGTEAILPTAHVMDRTVYGRQQDWDDSPEGWPQHPTYG